MTVPQVPLLPELPIVAWFIDTHGCPGVAIERASFGLLAERYASPLTDHTTATKALLAANERAATLEAERDKLREFANKIMESWPVGDVDGGSLQDAAIACGLIELTTPAPTKPCGEGCACAEYFISDEWPGGIECYHPTALLKGAAIDAQKTAEGGAT